MTLPHQHYMTRALQLAERGLYTTRPNPSVGCVLVRDGTIVGEGWHQAAGEPHAEIHALRAAGEQARGATCYVTLEPCCHHGRTPPCSEALIDAGVAEVIAAMEDPNPLVAGQGLRQLAAAGITVQAGVLQAEAEQLNPGFVWRMRHGRPFMRCKLAMSLDGRTAMATGESQWITGAEARRDVQTLRARSSAIMTGAGTVLADNPAMTVRPDDVPERLPASLSQPLRVIVDNYLNTPPDAKILRQPGQVLIFTGSRPGPAWDALTRQGADIIALPKGDGSIDLEALCRVLAVRDCNEVLVECGSTLSGSLLKAGLLDELVFYMAPVLMGDTAKGLFHLPWLKSMAQRVHLQIQDIRAVGKDWRITAIVA